MNRIRELHERAMELAEVAVVEKRKGNLARADQLFEEALENEVQAARLVPEDISSEPTRSILYRSAASLALDCNELREAEQLIAAALAGNPPETIAEELRDLFEQVNFQRHLDLRGVSLAAGEVQMSMAGRAISYGTAPSEEVVGRIEKAQKLVQRTIERIIGKPYREGGPASKEVRDYTLFVSVPRAASFAVSLKVSYPKQPALPALEDLVGLPQPSEVIDEVLTCLELFNKSEESKLREKIPEPAYYRNFVGLAKNIAPDGEQVNLVGFTEIRDGVERKVNLTQSPDEIQLSLESLLEIEPDARREKDTIIGRLLYADATSSDEQAIKLIDKNNKSHTVIVPEGMMSDVVKPLWEEIVQLTGLRIGKEIELIDIRRAPEDDEMNNISH